MGNLCSFGRKSHSGNQAESVMSTVLNESKDVEDRKVKMLLLGAGESGKTTMFKQMILLQGKEFASSQHIDFEKGRIIGAFFNAFGELCKAIHEQFGSLGNEELDEARQNYFDDNADRRMPTRSTLDPGLVRFIKDVWASQLAIDIWENRGSFQVTDSLAYFCEHVDRLAAPEYTVTEDDYLKCRIQSTGIVEQTFTFSNVKFVVVDVGGQRAERKKWIKCFDQVRIVLFVVAISEFDQKLFEDTTIDRVKEAKALFEKTNSFRVFQNTPFILFLNKVDLLEEKVEKLKRRNESLDGYFPHLQLGRDYDVDRIKADFKDQFVAIAKGKKIYPHFITATDRKIFTDVFQAVTYTILTEALTDHFNT